MLWLLIQRHTVGFPAPSFGLSNISKPKCMSSKGGRKIAEPNLNLGVCFSAKKTSVAIIISSVPLYVFLFHLFLFLSLFQVPTVGFLRTSVATIQPKSASCGLASAKLTGWLHEKTASFRNSTHCTVWTWQLLSAKDKQTDRERRQRERRGRKREARRTWETWKYVREQRSKRAKQNLWKMQQCLFFFFIALLWQHVWNWNVIRCLVWLLSLASTHSHTSQHTWKTASFNWWNNRLISSSLSFILIFLTSERCDTVLLLNFFRLLFCSLFLWPLCIKQGIKYDSSSVLQLETCESLWECGGVQNLPSLCERVKSQAGGSEYVWTIYVFSRHITPPPLTTPPTHTQM